MTLGSISEFGLEIINHPMFWLKNEQQLLQKNKTAENRSSVINKDFFS
jgi:hypothetical protein